MIKIIARSNEQSKNISVVTIPCYQPSHISEPVLVFLVQLTPGRGILYTLYIYRLLDTIKVNSYFVPYNNKPQLVSQVTTALRFTSWTGTLNPLSTAGQDK